MDPIRRTALAAATCLALAPRVASAQQPTSTPPAAAASPVEVMAEKAKQWFEKLQIRGYTQVRYNQLAETNEKLVNTQGDRSIGGDGGFFLRRARLVVQGDVHEHVSIYLQSDFASTVGEQLHAPTMRDWYADISLDKDKTFRFRVGQSKVPFGFENLQSSQNRAPFDRADATNSAFRDERELGVFVYYAPKSVRHLFKELANPEMKGSGDYGMVGLGVINGQGANKLELNATPHVVARVTYPFKIGNQIVEIGAAGYYGKYAISKDDEIGGGDEFRDVRAIGSFVLYPRPIGLQVEYNFGRGPELQGDRVVDAPLHGGYAMAMAQLGDFTPYVRLSRYDGARKFETNAPHYKVREIEAGLEWRPIKPIELTAAYTFAERTYPKPPYEQESGRLLRLQLQFNY